jgi:adenylate cyclase class 2
MTDPAAPAGSRSRIPALGAEVDAILAIAEPAGPRITHPTALLDPRRNVELKARDPDPAWSLGVCRALGAEDHGTVRQRDTYFNVAGGALKLREESPGATQLIQYERAERAQPRESRHRSVEIPDGPGLCAILQAALGLGGVVAKRRRLHLWHGVRIHLDEVDGLGSFIELEAVAAPASDLTREHALVEELREALAITDDRLVSRGYAALISR